MAVKLEGFVDDGRGAPLPNISAIVTRVTDGGIVTSGLTGPDGRWHFSGLSESEEYLVNLADGAGNAIVRGPWSGQLREAWIRDRLALPDSGTAILPNGGNTLVGTLPLVLDPNPANVLEWGPAGIYSAGAVGLTEEAADLLYEPIDSAYTKAESDALYSPIDAVVDAWTKAESDARYEPLDTMYTKAESDARYPQKTDVDPYPSYLTAAEADALFLTPTEGNAAYATSAHNHDTTYVQLTGGSVMTGLLGPTSNNTRDLGTTALRWRKLWAVDAEFTNAPTVGGTSLDSRYAATAHNHDASYVLLAGGSVMTGLLGPTTTNTRDLGTTALRWRKLWAVDGEFTNVPTVGGTSLDSRYSLAAHNHDASYVLLTGGSVMTGLLGPSTHNTRDLGTSGTRWRALYGMTGDFTTSLTVATKPITPSPDAANIIEFRANGLYAAAGAVTDIWVNTGGDTMTGDLNMTANVLPTVTNVRSLGSTSLRWLKVWATDADFTNAPTVGGSALLTATAADALFLTPAEGNTAYATAAHAHAAAYVDVGGDTMTGTLNMTASVVPTANNTYSLGYVSAQWNTINTVLLRLSGDGSTTAPVGTNGAVRLRNGPNGNLAWRNAGDTADLTLGVDTSNNVSITSGVERLRVDSNGIVKINPLTDPAFPAGYNSTPGLLVQNEGAHLNGLSLARASSTDAYAEALTFWRARGTFASKVAVANGESLGQITVMGWSGANWLASSVIQAAAGGTVTTTAVPGSLLFMTADSAGTLATRLSIAPDGVVNAVTALQVNSRPVIMAGVRAYHNANQSIASATLTVLAFNSERYDTDSFHDLVTLNSRLTVPTGLAGKYLITAHVNWAANTDANERAIGIRLGGATFIAYSNGPGINVAGIQMHSSVTTVYDLAVGNYIEITVFQASGVALNVLTSANFSPEVTMTRVG